MRRCSMTGGPKSSSGHRIGDGFATDGVCACVQHSVPSRNAGAGKRLTHLPIRGMWEIDQLKAATRADALHVVGVNPGKRELLVAVDGENPTRTAGRYTLRERQFDMQTWRTTNLVRRELQIEVQLHEEELCAFSRRGWYTHRRLCVLLR